MTKVILINPPVRIYDPSMEFAVYFPIGLLSIAAMVKGICEIKIFDCLITDFEIKRTKDYFLYGTPFERIEEAIKDFDPDIIGISIPFSTQADNAMAICRLCKEIKPGATVVFGGPDVSVRYKFYLEETPCDFCVIGEGEETFFEFVKSYNSKSSLNYIEGLAYKIEEEVYYKPRRFLEDLDRLPFPAYDIIDMEAYLNNKYLYGRRSSLKNSIAMITSRGCPFNCVFCSIGLHMGKRYRYHSPDYVLRHIRFLMENYGITNFNFEDDNISLNKNRFEEILDKIIEDKLSIRWDIPNGMRTDTLDLNLLKKIKESGCIELTIGIESGNQRVLDNVINKKSSLEHIRDILRHCKELKIRVSAFYVIGFPGETITNMKETIDLALELYRRYNVLPVMHFATPLYGTELYKICIENDLIKEDLTAKDFATATQVLGYPLISTEDFSRDDVKRLGRSFILRLYLLRLRKEFIFEIIKHPISTFKKAVNRLSILIRG